MGRINMSSSNISKRRQSKAHNPESYSIILSTAENIHEKLKNLDYEEHFVKAKKQKAFTKEQCFSFGSDTNPSLQFQYFLELMTWLFSLIQSNETEEAKDTTVEGDDPFFHINPYDDPNTIAHKIMIAVRELGFDADFPANKLKNPYGEGFVRVLDFLTDVAHRKKMELRESDDDGTLKYVGFYKNGKFYDDQNDSVEDETEILDESSISDDDNSNDDNDSDTNMIHEQDKAFMMENPESFIRHSHIDPMEWKKEVEKVRHRLQAPLERRGENWRYHLDQINNELQIIHVEYPSIESNVNRVQQALHGFLLKIQRNEDQVNKKFENVSKTYAKVKHESDKMADTCHKSNQNVNVLSNKLAQITKELDELKKEMDGKSGSISDTSPIFQIKSALKTLKKEIAELDLNIGVVNHTIQSKLQEMHASSNEQVDENYEEISLESDTDEK